MRILALAIASSVFASLAFAQLDPYTLTITATRSVAVQPDQAVLNVYVDSNPSAALTDILAAVQSVGLTQANLATVYSLPLTTAQLPGLEWSFSLTVPYSGMKDTLNKLGTLRSTIARQKSGLTLAFAVAGVQVSPQLQAAQTCPTAALVADATTQAQALAQAAGFGLGQISTLSDGSGGVVGAGAPAYVAISAYTLPAFSSFFQPVYSSTGSSCTIVAKFKLTLQ
jgi:hypothetical protein